MSSVGYNSSQTRYGKTTGLNLDEIYIVTPNPIPSVK